MALRAPDREGRRALRPATGNRQTAGVLPRGLLLGSGVALVVFVAARPNGSYGIGTWSAEAVAIWFAILLGIAFRLLPLAPVPRFAFAAAGSLAGLAVLAGASAAWSASAEQPVEELARVLLFLGVLVLVVLAARSRDLVGWSDGLALGITAVGALSLTARFFPGLLSGDQAVAFLSGVQTRLAYPLGYWTGLGVFVALAVPLMLRAAVAERSPLLRGAAVFPLPLLGTVLYLTSTRLGVVVAAVGAVLFFVFSHRRFAVAGAALAGALGTVAAILVVHARPELVNGPLGTAAARSDGRAAAVLVGLFCLGAAAVYGTAVALFPSPPRVSRARARTAAAVALTATGVVLAVSNPVQRFENFRSTPPGLASESGAPHLLNASSNGRWQLWRAAVDEFRHHPVLGGGAGSYQAWWARHGSLYAVARDAHSLFLEQLGELGVLGFLLVTATLAMGLVAAAMELRAAIGPEREVVAALAASFVAYVVAAGADWMWEMTVVSVVGIVLLGLLLRFGAPPPHAEGHSHRHTTAYRTILSAFALASMAIAATLFLGARAIGQSEHAAAAGDLGTAKNAALSAAALEPWAATPYLQLALVDERRGAPRAARDWIGRALRRDHTDWRLWLVAARIERSLGRDADAQASLERARTLNPRSPLFARAG